MKQPKIAIVIPNTLTVIGLKNILQDIMPIMTAETFSSFNELIGNNPEQYFHYFVAIDIVINNRQFFLDNKRKTIVLTASADSTMGDFHCLHTNLPEKQLIKSILSLAQGGHHHGRNLPAMPDKIQTKTLSDRELEVLSLIVQGYINKEIADRLNIGISTVITHRRNIMEKTGAKSVSSLTIYAVMNGFVDIEKI